VLAPVRTSSGYRTFQTDSDGSFSFTDIPLGDYILFAVVDVALEYTNPEIARPYLAAGRPVRIAAGVVISETISLTAVAQ
jgi:hypothetical protein